MITDRVALLVEPRFGKLGNFAFGIEADHSAKWDFVYIAYPF
jgi:hypothetical protein